MGNTGSCWDVAVVESCSVGMLGSTGSREAEDKDRKGGGSYRGFGVGTEVASRLAVEVIRAAVVRDSIDDTSVAHVAAAVETSCVGTHVGGSVPATRDKSSLELAETGWATLAVAPASAHLRSSAESRGTGLGVAGEPAHTRAAPA